MHAAAVDMRIVYVNSRAIRHSYESFVVSNNLFYPG